MSIIDEPKMSFVCYSHTCVIKFVFLVLRKLVFLSFLSFQRLTLLC